MRKVFWEKVVAVAAGLILLALVAGCGAEEGEIYPLTVDGTAITLDETKMQTIYDAGFEVTVLDTSTMDRYEIVADTPLDADSVYTGVSIGKNGEVYASVPLAELTEEKAKEVEKKLEDGEHYQSYVSDSRILRITREHGATGAVTQLEVEVRYEIDYSG